MAGIDLGGGLRNVFMFCVGAVATGAEKAQQVAEGLCEWGKDAGEQLSEKGSSVIDDTQDAMLRTWLESMSAEERAAYAQKIREFMVEIDAKDAEQAQAEPAPTVEPEAESEPSVESEAEPEPAVEPEAEPEPAVETEPEPEPVSTVEEGEVQDKQETTEG